MTPAKDAFAAAMQRAEEALRTRNPSRGPETPAEGASPIARLSDARRQKRAQEAAHALSAAKWLNLDAATLAKVAQAAASHVETSENWIFVMLGPKENAAVVRWLGKNSKRPQKAVELWATLLEHLRIDTGEITASRQELADRVGIQPRTLSELMSELQTINAISRQKHGRTVRYFLNPCIATHLPGATARRRARQEAGPLLKIMEAGPDG